MLLQSTFFGKAQKVYATLSEEQCSKYATVKATILNAYELVPEAYRQKFRKFTRSNGQTSLDKRKLFLIVGISLSRLRRNKIELKEVVLMEEFKNSVPLSIKTHLEEHQIIKLKKAAVVANDYELTHKMSVGKTNFTKTLIRESQVRRRSLALLLLLLLLLFIIKACRFCP